jgi:hypothetical protein
MPSLATLAQTMFEHRTKCVDPPFCPPQLLQLPWPRYTIIVPSMTGIRIRYESRIAASLHAIKANNCREQDAASDPDSKSYRPRARFAPTPIEQHINAEEPYYTSTSIQHELLPSSLARSPPGRSSTLPPGSHALKPNRPRKSSVGQNARRGKHERQKSKDYHRRLSYDRKAYSAEPATAAAIMGKRWEDLIDAAASATEEDSRDLTPVRITLLCLLSSDSDRCRNRPIILLTQ